MEMLIALSVFIATSALMWTVFTRPGSPIQRRLNAFKDLARVEDAPEEEPTFIERVVRPVLTHVLRLGRVLLPSSFGERIQMQLTKAGDPFSMTGLTVFWLGCALGLPALYLLLIGSSGLDQQGILLFFLIVAFGAYAPYQWLKIKTKRRQNQILKTLPDAIDLLTTSVEAGLGIDAAIGQVAEKVRGPIAVEFRRLLREMAMGSSRRDALKAFSERVDLPDVKVFVNALIQAEQMGVSLGQVIRVQADQMRLKRRQRAEQKAHAAPVKMSVPLVLFIFPTILVVILGPAFIQILRNLNNTK